MQFADSSNPAYLFIGNVNLELILYRQNQLDGVQPHSLST